MSELPKSTHRRAELVAEAARIRSDIDEMLMQAVMLDREIAGLDFAIAEAGESVSIEQPKPSRMDIAQAVLGILDAAGPHDVGELAAVLERKPSQVSAALTRLSSAGNVELVAGTSDRYSLVTREAAKAAE